MDEQTPNKRLPPYSYRPPVELREEFERRIQQSGLSLSAFITKAWSGSVLPRQIKVADEKSKTLAKLLADSGQIKDRINDMRVCVPDVESFDEFYKAVQAELLLIRTVIMKEFRRK